MYGAAATSIGNGEAADFVMRQAEYYSISERHLARTQTRVGIDVLRMSRGRKLVRDFGPRERLGSLRPWIPDR